MISAKLGHFLDRPLAPFIGWLPLSPNALTVAGFIITGFAALTIPFNLKIGGILIVAGGVCDMLDGVLARTTGRVSEFGAFLDSVLDRYSDAFLFLSIAWYLAAHGNHTASFVSLATLVGAFLISYARARAEGLGKSCRTGIMERPERIILLIFATLTGWLTPILWVMLVLTHITVLQRIYIVWRDMKKSGKLEIFL